MTRAVDRLRRVGRRALSAAAAVGVVGTVGAVAGVGAPAARALPIPVSPTDPSVAQQWANPAIRQGEGQRALIELVNAPSTIAAHEPFTATVRITNRSDEPLEGLSVTPRRGPATGSTWDQRAATVADISEYTTLGRNRDVEQRLDPGESVEVMLQISEDEIPLPGLATYPLMFVLSGDGTVYDTERFHLSIRGVSGGPRPGLSALYPVTAPIDIVPGETGAAPHTAPLMLTSENLADQLAPGGRLESLVRIYAEATAADPSVAAATCLALDPALVDTVERMAGGYTVSSTRPAVVEEPKRLRDSWGSANDVHLGTPGRGSADARAWLETISQIAATQCIVALPWANSDVNAVARTGDAWLMREAVERGPFTLERVLGTTGVLNTVIPSTGYIEPGTAPALGWADHSRSTVRERGMQTAWDEAHSAVPAAGGGRVAGTETATLDTAIVPDSATAAAPAPTVPVRALVASSTVQHDPATGRFSWIAPGVMAVQYQDSLTSTLAAVGPRPETTGHSAEAQRYVATRDSARARAINAASAIHLAVGTARDDAVADNPVANDGLWDDAGEGTGIPAVEPQPVLVAPPASWDADSAATIMEAVRTELRDTARPMPLEEYLTVPAAGEDPDVSRETLPAAQSTGTLENDPSRFTDSEILTASQQARFANDLTALLTPDPAIALSPYGFTLPLRRDLLIALSATQRRAIDSYDNAVGATRTRLAGSRDTMNDLRAAIALIPPGNVYTRASSSSPLLIVAKNGLPLPVVANILYTGPDGATLHLPTNLRIPAHGSVTAQMTADLPEDRPADLKLFLASRQGVPISEPVDISVRTVGMATQGRVILSSLAAGLVLLLLFTAGRHRRARSKPPATAPPPVQPPTNPPTTKGRWRPHRSDL
ncbi:hypothetical protein [Corynebacterium sp.]|uniref:hypothetical protein n=1 Tax=Corynebacterium sp. TaxID=1720 RepID=UPI002A91AAD5|nr:hypothetical protein [Corynebacterium sp.]MDY5785690.1 hypothetical protein [Corynebacterium sp.]